MTAALSTVQQVLSGSVAIVTGASRGLGAAYARGLSAAGARVALIARTCRDLDATVRSIESVGGHAVAFAADVSRQSEIESAMERVALSLGDVDLLVNNAGIMAPIGRDWEVDPAAWWHTMEVNVLGSFLCARAVLPNMVKRGHGRIINVSSSAAYKRYPYYSAYGASKAALEHFTGSLAESVRPFGVKVFALSPGFVQTDMTEALANAPELQRFIGDGFRRALDEGRHTPIASAVDAVLFLASGAGDDLSGEHIDVRDDLLTLVRQVREKAAK